MAKFKSNAFAQELRRDIKEFKKQNPNLKADFKTYLYYVAVTLLVIACHLNFYLIHRLDLDNAALFYIANGVLLSLTLIVFGLSVAHDINHGSAFHSSKLTFIFGFSLDLILGVSSFWWRSTHVGHHGHTNQVSANEHSQDKDWQKLAQLRKLLIQSKLPRMFKILVICTIFSCASFLINHVFFAKTFHEFKISAREFLLWLAFKIVFLGYAIFLPLKVFDSALGVLSMFLLVHLISSFGFFIVFAIAHTNPKVATIDVKNTANYSWEESQILTTANYSLNDSLITLLHGGLNFQIEHHLFPDINPRHYPALSKIIRRHCENHNIPYVAFDTTTDGIVQYLQWATVGNLNLKTL